GGVVHRTPRRHGVRGRSAGDEAGERAGGRLPPAQRAPRPCRDRVAPRPGPGPGAGDGRLRAGGRAAGAREPARDPSGATRAALVFTLVLAVTITAVGELHAPFAPVAALGGVTAVYSVSRLRHRWHFARATLVIAVVTIAAILAWDLARSMTFATLLRDVMWGGLSSFLSVSIAFLLLPPVEHLFGLTSDITLLELSDLNRPLLKRMQLEVPGT